MLTFGAIFFSEHDVNDIILSDIKIWKLRSGVRYIRLSKAGIIYPEL